MINGQKIFAMMWGIFLSTALGCAGHEARNAPAATMNSQPAPNAPTGVAYQAPKGHFEMMYPKAWKSDKGDTMLTLVLEKNTEAGHIAVDVPPLPFHLPGMINVGEVDDGYIKDQKKRMTDLAVDNNTDQMLAGAKAKRIHARAKLNGKPMVLDALVAVKDDTVYVLSAETDPSIASDAKAAMDQIISSWKWTK